MFEKSDDIVYGAGDCNEEPKGGIVYKDVYRQFTDLDKLCARFFGCFAILIEVHLILLFRRAMISRLPLLAAGTDPDSEDQRGRGAQKKDSE